MAIPDEDVAQVRAATDIVALIGEHVALKRQGTRWVGRCPFHTERTPSFSVNAEKGFYYCFGCQASGDAITFLRATEHLDFADAVRHLAERSGVTIREDGGGADRKRRTELLAALEEAVDWYHKRLLSAPDAGPARDYLRSRGYDGETVRRFRLGWAPDEWDALARALRRSERVMTDTGLGFVNRNHRMQDAFKARVIFPICDPSGRPLGLGGRILPAPEGTDTSDRRPEPKYKNSQETAIYSKRRVLYALNWAKKDIVASGEVVVCEGYTDVIGFFGAGVPRAVATCGTALAEEHFTLLRNFAKRIVLAYDADSAGQSAVARFYEWERRHEVEVAVAALPPGADPGDLARTDPDALRDAVTGARPFLQFRVDRVLNDADLSTVEGRARAADAALDAVAAHPDDLVRDQYVMQIADRCRLDPARARERLEEARRRGAAGDDGGRRSRSGPDRSPAQPFDAEDEHRPPAAAPTQSVDPSSRPGLEALRLAVHRPGDVADRLDEVLFVDDVQRRAFSALVDANSLHEAVEEAPPDVAALLRRVAVEEPVVLTTPLVDPVDAVVAQLVRGATRRALVDVQMAVRTAGGELGPRAAETASVHGWLEELDDPETCREAADRLLAWLLAAASQEGT